MLDVAVDVLAGYSDKSVGRSARVRKVRPSIHPLTRAYSVPAQWNRGQSVMTISS